MEKFNTDETIDPFQKIMEKVGNHGRFQLIYNMIFVLGLATAGAMTYMNNILALNTPDHWCTVPGRERTEYNLEQWKQITLPLQKDNRGKSTPSNCEMYDADFTKIDNWKSWNSSTMANVTVCQHGWTYDKTWYEDTISSEENWVCSKDMYVTNAYMAEGVAEVVGSFVFGQMGDIYGRRFVYYISVVLCAAGRFLSIMTASQYTLFLIGSALTGMAITSMFLTPQIVGMEISREDDRSTIAIYQSIGWSIGSMLMPLLYWWLRGWRSFMWITSIATALFLLLSKYVIESPRWLIGKQRFADAIKQFQKIAKINGREFTMTERELRQIYREFPEDKVYGMVSLFDGWRLARNTTIMAFSWCVVTVSNYTLMLFSSRMAGNPFLNFLYQTLVEVPSYGVGKYMGDKYGRRFTNSFTFFISFLVCIPAIICAVDEKYEILMIALTTFIKFLNAVTFFTVNLQSMEIYPTCIRQTGIALGTILANSVSLLSPYLVYLGTTVNIRSPYYILGTLFLFGAIAAAYLPETLHKKLPDTIEEAREFGRYDKFFSLPKQTSSSTALPEAEQKLNQIQFAP